MKKTMTQIPNYLTRYAHYLCRLQAECDRMRTVVVRARMQAKQKQMLDGSKKRKNK
jgi:hypothetical protein